MDEGCSVITLPLKAEGCGTSALWIVEPDQALSVTGVYLSKDLMAIAGHALKANITTLAPLVLPVSEQLLFFINLVARKVRITIFYS